MSGWSPQSLVGLLGILAVCWGLSERRDAFPWRLAGLALALQVGLVGLLFGLPQAQGALNGVNAAVDALAGSTQAGSRFVFGFLAGGDQPYPLNARTAPFLLGFRGRPPWRWRPPSSWDRWRGRSSSAPTSTG